MRTHLSVSLLGASLVLFGAGCQMIQLPSVMTPSREPARVEPASSTPIVGGDRDVHGCIGSAGYSWCETKSKCLRIWEEACPASAVPTKKGTVLVSTADPMKFCNGADMDSVGFRKTITKEQAVTFPKADETMAERARSIAALVTSGQCQEAFKELTYTVVGDTISIPPLNAWAGSSIAFCSCKPLVEVNLLRLPGITNVVWENP